MFRPLLLCALLLFGSMGDLRGQADILTLSFNIPSGFLVAQVGGAVLDSFPVSAGMPRYSTPRGEFRISTVYVNPWWHPPASRWAAGKTAMSPGPDNPMGRAKLHLEGLYYIHGTPAHNENKLGRPASHGCIRMSNADVLVLTRMLVQYGGADISTSELERLEHRPRRSRTVRLSRPVPVGITYQLATIRDERLVVYPDVYGIGNKRDAVLSVLKGAGFAEEDINPVRLATMLRGSSSKPTAARLSDLIFAPVPQLARNTLRRQPDILVIGRE